VSRTRLKDMPTYKIYDPDGRLLAECYTLVEVTAHFARNPKIMRYNPEFLTVTTTYDDGTEQVDMCLDEYLPSDMAVSAYNRIHQC
jgi:hypothetical protein